MNGLAADRQQLLAKVRALPAARPLLARLGDCAGIHLVGGAVRDLLLGSQPTELDLVVEDDLQGVLSRLGGSARTHDRFGTATVRVDQHTYDVAIARSETYERGGVLPDVAPASVEQDLLRRDFGVNALAIALGGAAAGALTAAPGALADLHARRLRVLHPRSFEDDPTRLFRLVRYATRLGFEVEPGTAALACRAVQAGALATVSGARLGTELRLLARERDPVRAIDGLHEWGLDRAIQPAFGLTEPELARQALALLPADGQRWLLVLAVATCGIQAPDLERLLAGLAFDRPALEVIVAAATRSQTVADALEQATLDSQIATELRGAPVELAALAGALGPAGKAKRWLERLRHARLEIDGTDLLAAGVPPGPAIGRGLQAALSAKLDGRAPDRAAELAEAVQAAR